MSRFGRLLLASEAGVPRRVTGTSYKPAERAGVKFMPPPAASLEVESFVPKAGRGTTRLPRNVERRAQNSQELAAERLLFRIIARAGDRDTRGGDVVMKGGALGVQG